MSNDIAIRVENLSKLYHIGQLHQRPDTLRDALSGLFRRGKENGHAPHDDTDLWALKDVSFEVKRGEVVGVIGRNGAGKSTLLKILTRITEPTSGRAEIHGRVASLLEVGTGFHPELTGRENIYLNGAILGMRKMEIERKFDEIVAFAEIEKFMDTPVKRYSSGMHVRLAFAVAAHLEPEILLVDEVLAVGDAAFQKKCLGKMGDVASEGRTILFVSHNMAAISNLCRKAILFDTGSVREIGASSEVIEHYLVSLNSSGATTNLSDRTDRKGNGLARFDRFRLLHSGREVQRIKMGETLTVEASFTANASINRPVFGIFLKDFFGNTILRAYSHESARYVPIDSKMKGLVRCSFSQIPLMHGEYSLALWLGKPGECIDYIENITKLVIDPADVYETGVLPDKNNGGLCYAEHHWEFEYGLQNDSHD